MNPLNFFKNPVGHLAIPYFLSSCLCLYLVLYSSYKRGNPIKKALGVELHEEVDLYCSLLSFVNLSRYGFCLRKGNQDPLGNYD